MVATARNLKTQLHCDIELHNTKINHATKYEYLGVTLDKHLSMSDQTSKVHKRVNQRVNLLKRVRINLSPSAAQTIYNSMIEPIAFYCAPIYSGIAPFINKLTILENKVHTVINCPKRNKFENKIKQRTVVEVFKYLHGIKKNEPTINFELFNHSFGTRGNGNRLVVPKSKNEAGRRSFVVQGALTYNFITRDG